MLEEIVSSEASDYRQFFMTDTIYTTQRMEAFYGEEWKATSDPFGMKTKSMPDQRFGV